MFLKKTEELPLDRDNAREKELDSHYELEAKD